MCAENATSGFAIKSENQQILKRVGNIDYIIEKTKQNIRSVFAGFTASAKNANTAIMSSLISSERFRANLFPIDIR